MNLDKQIDELLGSIDNAAYPGEFLARYTMMECLSQHDGVETFLVMDQNEKKYIAKCFDRSVWSVNHTEDIMKTLCHSGLPMWKESFENEKMTVTVREYIDGVSLDRYCEDNKLGQNQIVDICVQLCDILSCLHNREEPIIHRDVKPQNLIFREDGSVVLIDFDIARIYHEDNDTDTVPFVTKAYAPPEQFGYGQTDVRADIYSLGILLRWLMTGSVKANKNIRIYKPLQKIIDKCTAFSPQERFSNAEQVKKALLAANPRSQFIRKYGTHLFDNPDELATYGMLKEAMVELYGLDRDYVYASAEDGAVPAECDEYFLAWPWDDSQMLFSDIAQYAAVKVHDPSIVADWSSVKEIDGMYPGVIVAKRFCEEHGILTGVHNPTTIFVRDLALILANADRVFDAVQDQQP